MKRFLSIREPPLSGCRQNAACCAVNTTLHQPSLCALRPVAWSSSSRPQPVRRPEISERIPGNARPGPCRGCRSIEPVNPVVATPFSAWCFLHPGSKLHLQEHFLLVSSSPTVLRLQGPAASRPPSLAPPHGFRPPGGGMAPGPGPGPGMRPPGSAPPGWPPQAGGPRASQPLPGMMPPQHPGHQQQQQQPPPAYGLPNVPSQGMQHQQGGGGGPAPQFGGFAPPPQHHQVNACPVQHPWDRLNPLCLPASATVSSLTACPAVPGMYQMHVHDVHAVNRGGPRLLAGRMLMSASCGSPTGLIRTDR